MEKSSVYTQVIADRLNARRRLFKTITQSVIMTIIIEVVSLFLSALIVVLLHVGSIRWQAFITVSVSMVITFFGLWVLAIWLDLR